MKELQNSKSLISKQDENEIERLFNASKDAGSAASAYPVFCRLKHRWSRWLTSEDGRMINKDNSASIGYIVTQKQICLRCNCIRTRSESVLNGTAKHVRPSFRPVVAWLQTVALAGLLASIYFVGKRVDILQREVFHHEPHAEQVQELPQKSLTWSYRGSTLIGNTKRLDKLWNFEGTLYLTKQGETTTRAIIDGYYFDAPEEAFNRAKQRATIDVDAWLP